MAQLEHKRKNLPEHTEVAVLQGNRAAVASDLVEADTAVFDLEADQERAEADLEPVRQRLLRDQQRIDAGSVSDPKALTAIVDEVEHLKRRISDLEDAELEVMEALEAATAVQAKLRAAVGSVEEDLAAIVERRDGKLERIAAEVQKVKAEREQVLPDVPADLLALYTKLAANHGGVGAAELRQRRCVGCQLEVNAADLRTFKAAPADEVLRCEECSRILVRTADSGL